MKTSILVLFLSLFTVNAMAQMTLTYPNNSLHACDTNSYEEISLTDAGSAGAGQIWDFTGYAYTGKSLISIVQDATLPKIGGIGDYNLSLLDNGYDYMMNSTESDLDELGYVNKEMKLVLTYSDPVKKMKYPFAYGNQFTDRFVGVAIYSEVSSIDFAGENSVIADGWGTLKLPDKTLEGVLRVKSVKTGLQVNMCGTADVNIVKYNWYAPGYRYPVLSLNIVANSTNGAAPVVTRSAYTNLKQNYDKRAVLTAGNSLQASLQSAESDAIVSISPNPFSDVLKYQYRLNAKARVTIELFDQQGKLINYLINEQLQVSGIHYGEMVADKYHLLPGVYYLRFSFDNETFIRKAVKY